MLTKLLLIALAGACGTLCRFGGELAMKAIFGVQFLWSVLLINAIGCGLFGWFWTFSSKRMLADAQWHPVIFIGFLGAFTTFSTYAFQTMQLASSGRVVLAATNFILQNAVGFLAVALGMALGSR